MLLSDQFEVVSLVILICNEISGTGVFVTKSFAPGAFLLKYPGDLMSEDETQKRENQYAKESKGCFMYFLEYENKTTW